MKAFTYLLFPALFIVLGCQVAPTRYSEMKEGQWEARALIRDKRSRKSFIVNLDINAVQKERMRVDVTAALGHPVASMVLQGSNLSYVLIETQEAYKGPAKAEALRPVLSIPLTPKYLYSVLFDFPIEDKRWTCTKTSDGFIEECKDRQSKTIVRWKDRKGRRKTVYIEHPTAALQINFNSFQPKVESRDNLFGLKIPDNFKLLRM